MSISKAFGYFSDVELYPTYYPEYCQRINVVDRTNNSITTNELWNFVTDEGNYIKLRVHYRLNPPSQIHYEIISGYQKAVGIKNAVMLSERGKNKTAIRGNNVLLDTISFPPHILKHGNFKHELYNDMIDYFITRDCIRLENKPLEPFKIGQICPQCQNGHLEKYKQHKEDFEKKN